MTDPAEARFGAARPLALATAQSVPYVGEMTSKSRTVRDITTAWGDLRVAYSRGGWRSVRRELARRTVRRVIHTGRALVIETPLDAIQEAPIPEDVRIEPFNGSDWSVLAGIATPKGLRRFQRAAAPYRTCFVAWVGDRPIGYHWLSTRIERHVERYPVPLPDGAVYGFDSYVDRTERNRGISRALSWVRANHARELGYRTTRAICEPDNTAILRAILAYTGQSAQVVGEIRYIHLFRWMRARHVPKPPRPLASFVP